ncbi:MAG: glycosyltransferase family 2 protein [Lachnospiraceae bacterium]|jgi:glycosyltransferase involved in cell wall biosynthesis|nr:glycosyltransferase family 2 protein [Lachnospiraceae bacterium]
MKLIIQIPCYNEAETLEITLNDLPRELEGIDVIEYLVIDDGSTDDTAKVAQDWGVHHIARFKQNRGLAKGFMAGLDAALRNGADIIVNTDADNQYVGADIATLIAPILAGEADIVVGARPIAKTPGFSWLKKCLQRFGSWVVRKASHTEVADAPSGFRAYSREAAIGVNVINDYTYTLETIVQAGRNHLAIISVPIRTNPELRESRLINSMWGYVKKSMVTILRTLMWYRPLTFFSVLALFPSLIGFGVTVRFLVAYFTEGGAGHIQSLILACTLMIIGFVTFVIGLLADVNATNRRILEDIQYRMRKMVYDGVDNETDK